MKLGYSQAEIAKDYYDEVKPGNKYDNRKANNQFCQDQNIDWDKVLDIIARLNFRSLTAATRARRFKMNTKNKRV